MTGVLVTAPGMTDAELLTAWAARLPEWPLQLDPPWLQIAAGYLAGRRHCEPADRELHALSGELLRRLHGIAR